MNERDNKAAIVDGLAAQLSGVHLAAQGHPVPFYPPPDATELHTEAKSLGSDLAVALFSSTVTLVRCSEAAPESTQRSVDRKVLTFHGRRLIVTATGRRSQLPHSGLRMPRYLVTDIELLSVEGHRGVTVGCHQCGQLHRITISWLAKAKTHSITSKPVSKPPSAKLYPDVEEAAFAEVLGPLDQGPAAAPRLLIGLTPERLARFRDMFADRPDVLGMSHLFSNNKTLVFSTTEEEQSHTSAIPAVPPESPGGPWEHAAAPPEQGRDPLADGGVPPPQT